MLLVSFGIWEQCLLVWIDVCCDWVEWNTDWLIIHSRVCQSTAMWYDLIAGNDWANDIIFLAEGNNIDWFTVVYRTLLLSIFNAIY